MNRAEAKDAIYTFATTAAKDAFAWYGMDEPTLRYARTPNDEPAQGSWWARISMQTVLEEQETLRLNVRRFKTEGFAYVQLFAPSTDGQWDLRLDQIAEYVRNRFREPFIHENLEFTAAAIDDNVPAEPAWLPLLVRARFAYRQFL